MATFGTIKTDVQSWLNRPDFDSQIESFISIAMRKIERGNNLNYMLTSASPSIVAGTETITAPTGYKESLYWYLVENDSKHFLIKKEVAAWDRYQGDYTPDQNLPTYYTYRAGSFLLIPPSDDTYTNVHRYYGFTQQATEWGDTTNWITENHPEVLIYGACLEAAPFLGEDSRIVTWATLYEKTIGEIRAQDTSESWGGADVRMVRV